MRSDVIFETKCPASTLNEHMGCFSACCLSLMVSKPERTQRAELQGSVGPVGGLASTVHGAKAVLGARSGDTRIAPMPYFARLPLPGWLGTEMPFAHWKHSPNSSTEVSSSSPLYFYSIPRYHGQPAPCVTWGCGDAPLSRAELTGKGIFPWQSGSGSRIRSETNMSLSISKCLYKG